MMAKGGFPSFYRLLIHPRIQIDNDIDRRDEDLGGDEDDHDPFEVFAWLDRSAKTTTRVDSISA